jgi:hypothetical protein
MVILGANPLPSAERIRSHRQHWLSRLASELPLPLLCSETSHFYVGEPFWMSRLGWTASCARPRDPAPRGPLRRAISVSVVHAGFTAPVQVSNPFLLNGFETPFSISSPYKQSPHDPARHRKPVQCRSERS